MNNTELGSLKELLEKKKAEEAIALVKTASFVETYGKGMMGGLEKSIKTGNFEEALELVTALGSFMTTAAKNLRQQTVPNFGMGRLPDDDW
ncbi:MAG: hypothetical protein WA058_02500 [Minisyncoccia bacterium]